MPRTSSLPPAAPPDRTWKLGGLSPDDDRLPFSADPLHSAIVALLARHRECRTSFSRLWLAVIAQAIFDALFSVSRKRAAERAAAAAWFGSPDFETVCDLAGLDAGFVRRAIELLRPLAEKRYQKRQRREQRRLASVKRIYRCRLT